MPDERRDKLDVKGTKCLFLDYCEGTKAYRLMCLQTKNIIKSRDVVFMKNDTIIFLQSMTHKHITIGAILSTWMQTLTFSKKHPSVCHATKDLSHIGVKCDEYFINLKCKNLKALANLTHNLSITSPYWNSHVHSFLYPESYFELSRLIVSHIDLDRSISKSKS